MFSACGEPVLDAAKILNNPNNSPQSPIYIYIIYLNSYLEKPRVTLETDVTLETPSNPRNCYQSTNLEEVVHGDPEEDDVCEVFQDVKSAVHDPVCKPLSIIVSLGGLYSFEPGQTRG